MDNVYEKQCRLFYGSPIPDFSFVVDNGSMYIILNQLMHNTQAQLNDDKMKATWRKKIIKGHYTNTFSG